MVMHDAAIPDGHIARTIAVTTSALASAAFGSCPAKPLTWRSIQPGPIQVTSDPPEVRAISATIPSRIVIRAGRPSSISRP